MSVPYLKNTASQSLRGTIRLLLLSPRLALLRRLVPGPARRWVGDFLEPSLLVSELRFKRTVDWALTGQIVIQAETIERVRPTEDSYLGMNVYGYFSRWLGLGECARLFAKAMLAADWPISLHDVDIAIPHGRRDHSLAPYMGRPPSFPYDLVFVNPDHWGDMLLSSGQSESPRRYVIGYWFWELEIFPDGWLAALGQVDEVMVSSAFVERAVRCVCDKPITRVPLPLSLESDSGLQRCHFDLRDSDYIFFCSFDFASSVARKNPYAVIAAFLHAFPHGDEAVSLLIKSSNGERYVPLMRDLLQTAARDRRIMVRDDMLERGDLQALHRCADVYVSLHRCEGFGLGMAEAMRMGKPVIATAYSGNLDFMNTGNSCLVNYRMIPVRQGEYPHADGQYWADADHLHAAQYMRALYEDREMGARLGRQAAGDMMRDFSVEACMEVLKKRMQEITREREV